MLSLPFPYSYRRKFAKTYACHPLSKLGEKWTDNAHASKIILPRLDGHYFGFQSFPTPLFFKLTNHANQTRSTHVGVIEFSAEKGNCYIPDGIYRLLELKKGDYLNVEQVTLPVGTLVRFKPIGLEFLSIKNPCALLVRELRRYCCLTRGDVIRIGYKNRIYELRVHETKPGEAVGINIEALQIEFDVPECHINPYVTKGNPLCFVGDGWKQCCTAREKSQPPKQSVTISKLEFAVPEYHIKQTIPYMAKGKPLSFVGDGWKLCYNARKKAQPFKDFDPSTLPKWSYSLGQLQIDRSNTSITDCVPVSISLTLLKDQCVSDQNEEVD